MVTTLYRATRSDGAIRTDFIELGLEKIIVYSIVRIGVDYIVVLFICGVIILFRDFSQFDTITSMPSVNVNLSILFAQGE